MKPKYLVVLRVHVISDTTKLEDLTPEEVLEFVKKNMGAYYNDNNIVRIDAVQGVVPLS